MHKVQSPNPKAKPWAKAFHLVTILQGLMVGDGDWVSKQGVREPQKKLLAQCICACWLAAILVSHSRKTISISCLSSLSKTLEGVAPSNLNQEIF